jgi:hypothetical protein
MRFAYNFGEPNKLHREFKILYEKLDQTKTFKPTDIEDGINLGMTVQEIKDCVDFMNSIGDKVKFPDSLNNIIASNVNYLSHSLDSFQTGFKGSIDELRIWSGAISENQINLTMRTNITFQCHNFTKPAYTAVPTIAETNFPSMISKGPILINSSNCPTESSQNPSYISSQQPSGTNRTQSNLSARDNKIIFVVGVVIGVAILFFVISIILFSYMRARERDRRIKLSREWMDSEGQLMPLFN